MKQYLLFISACVLLFSSCNEQTTDSLIIPTDPEYITTCDSCFLFSNIVTKSTYFDDFIMFLDYSVAEIDSLTLNGYKYEFFDTLSINKSGYYDFILYKNDELLRKQFVLVDENRSTSEWGLKKWIPTEPDYVNSVVGNIIFTFPKAVPAGVNVPLMVKTMDGNNIYPNYIKGVYGSDKKYNMKRGIGSFQFIKDEDISDYSFSLGSQSIQYNVETMSTLDVITLDSDIVSDLVIENNQLVTIEQNLNIASGVNVSISDGAVILISEGVTVYNEGSIVFSGTDSNPILVTCTDPNSFFGGFVSRGESALIEAENTFFCQAGFNRGNGFSYGHAGRQALFKIENSILNLQNCFMLDHVGQVFYPSNAQVTLENTLIQRAKTGGQFNSTTTTIKNCIFTDFPNDNNTFLDYDNDALYMSKNCFATITNCTFMYAKDDGLDSGSSSGGNIEIYDSHFEACFHEGAGLSSDGGIKTHILENCVFTNCGQGLELGFSSSEHTVTVTDCSFYKNHIGIRYGDNYEWAHPNGKLIINQSKSLNNDVDVWNMVREIWEPRYENTEFNNLLVSKYHPQYPELEIYND